MSTPHTAQAVRRLALERPEWLPVLRAAVRVARAAATLGEDFPGSAVVTEAKSAELVTMHIPGLRTLVTYGLITPTERGARNGRTTYYTMPDAAAIKAELDHLDCVFYPDDDDRQYAGQVDGCDLVRYAGGGSGT